MRKIFTILIVISYSNLRAQELYSKLIPLNDTTISQFTDINGLYFLKQENKAYLKKKVGNIVDAKTPQQARKYLLQLAETPNELHNVLCAFDYYFKNVEPAPNSNVETFVNHLKANRDIYYTINKKNLYNIDTSLQMDSFISKVQQKIGWQYGYGAFTYTTTYDSLYIATMKKYDVTGIDNQIIEIIEHYLQSQTPIYKYPANDILKEVLQINGVKDAIWDHCVVKTMGLPNWDNLGVIIVKGKDTIERIYNLQITKSKNIRIGKRIFIPLKMSEEVWFRKVMYGLHWVRHTREQCIINQKRD